MFCTEIFVDRVCRQLWVLVRHMEVGVSCIFCQWSCKLPLATIPPLLLWLMPGRTHLCSALTWPWRHHLANFSLLFSTLSHLNRATAFASRVSRASSDSHGCIWLSCSQRDLLQQLDGVYNLCPGVLHIIWEVSQDHRFVNHCDIVLECTVRIIPQGLNVELWEESLLVNQLERDRDFCDK